MSQLAPTTLIIEVGIPPVLTALLAALGVWWKTRIDRRDRIAQRHHTLTEIQEEIKAVEAWVNAYKLVAPPEACSEMNLKAQDHLEESYTRLSSLLKAAHPAEAPIQMPLRQYLRIGKRASIGNYLKALLLIRPFQTRSAKVFRAFYYVSLLYAIIFFPIGINSAFNGGPGYTNAEYISLAIVLTILVTVLPSVVLYIETIRSDRRAHHVAAP